MAKSSGTSSPSKFAHFHHMSIDIMTGLDLGNVLFLRSLTILEPVLKTALVQCNAFSETFCSAEWWDLPNILSCLRKNKKIRQAVFLESAASPSNSVKSNIGEIVSLRNNQAHSGLYGMTDVKRSLSSVRCLASTLKTPPRNVGSVLDSLDEIYKIGEAMSPSKDTTTSVEKQKVIFETIFEEDERLFSDRVALPAARLYGREEHLKGIVSVLNDFRLSTGACRFLLHGQPGVGKTALAREILRSMREQFPFQHLFQATTKESLRASCSLFMASQSHGKPEEVILGSEEEVFRHLDNTSDTYLLVFDDVTDAEMALRVLPEGRHCAVFTSVTPICWRKSSACLSDVFATELKTLSTQSSLDLFKDILAKNGGTPGLLSAEKMVKIGRFLEAEMSNLPLAVRLAAFQFLSGKFSEDGFSTTTGHQLDTGRSSEDIQAARTVHIRGFHHLVNTAVEGLSEDQLAKDLCFALSLLPANGVPFVYVDHLVQVLQPDIDVSSSQTSMDKLLMTGLVKEEEGDIWVMHVICQTHVQSLLVNYAKRQDVCFAIYEMFSTIANGFSGAKSFVMTRNAKATLGLADMQTFLSLLSSCLTILSCEEERLSCFDVEILLLGLQKSFIYSMQAPVADINAVDQRLTELVSSSQFKSAKLWESNPDPRNAVNKWRALIEAYGVLSRQYKTCPLEVIDLAEQSVRKAPKLIDRVEVLSKWFHNFLWSNDYQAIDCLAAKLNLLPNVLINEFVATGFQQYLIILTIFCCTLIERCKLGEAERLVCNVLRAIRITVHPVDPGSWIPMGHVAERLADECYSRHQYSSALHWWNVAYFIQVRFPYPSHQILSFDVCRHVMDNLSRGINTGHPAEHWRLLAINVWNERIERLKTKVMQSICEPAKLWMSYCLQKCCRRLSESLGNYHSLTKAVLLNFSDFLVSISGPAFPADIYSFALQVLKSSNSLEAKTFSGLFTKMCESLSRSPPSTKNGNLLFALFMHLWPWQNTQTFSSTGKRLLVKLATYMVCMFQDYDIIHGGCHERVTFLLCFIVAFSQITPDVIGKLKILSKRFRQKGNPTLASRLWDSSFHLWKNMLMATALHLRRKIHFEFNWGSPEEPEFRCDNQRLLASLLDVQYRSV